jgi:hypothetical protein
MGDKGAVLAVANEGRRLVTVAREARELLPLE